MGPNLVVGLALSSIALAAATAPAPREFPGRLPAHAAQEAARLRAHFDNVRHELSTRDLGTLHPAQRANRARLISWLQEYRDTGLFPVNEGFADREVPIFRDGRGTLCAMAYLIARSGRRDIVEAVATTRNLARIPDLATMPGLSGWLDSVGLSLDEATRIQPTYQPPPGTVFEEDAVSESFAIGSLFLGGAAIGAGVLNLAGPTKERGWAALLLGTTIAGLGAANLDGESAATARLGIADMMVGGAAVVLGLRSLLRSDAKEPRASSQQEPLRMRLSPLLVADGSSRSVGVLLGVRF